MRLPLIQLRQHSTLPLTNSRSHIYAQNALTNAFSHILPNPPPPPMRGGPLMFLTAAIKDNICTSDMPTTCSSAILRDFRSPFDATVVKLLKEADAEVIGKTNCDEFGMGSLNTHSIHGAVVNPFSLTEKRSAGGSSGGSAAAVAADMCSIAIGTDTGGSIRLPASYCGVVGFKPSYGLISRWGVVSYADSLDCVGVLAKGVVLVRNVFDVLDIHDPKDPTSVSASVRKDLEKTYSANQTSLQNLRIGIPTQYFPTELSPSILAPLRRTLSLLQEQGATLVPVDLPMTKYALGAYYVLASAEASSNLARYDGVEYGLRVENQVAGGYKETRSKGFGEEVKKRLLLGTYALSAGAYDNYFLQAQKIRQLIREDFDHVFRWTRSTTTTPNTKDEKGVDVLIHPTAIRTAPLLSSVATSDAAETYLQDIMTVPASLAGLPALSVPVPGDGDGEWPIGMSVVGQWGCDRTVLDVGGVVEALNSQS
ncbi:Trimeric GatFAB AmidoTransferase(AdT) complex subunit [Paramarasmius palmivorus]|uniref:Glutamyl-tRNA(Gln) amidotransferase subunit A, mitochondrial n=1 Tax=Paramarasmius palmivorus TaxID=297713 RepID=A0AAW0CL46_9AGAR